MLEYNMDSLIDCSVPVFSQVPIEFNEISHDKYIIIPITFSLEIIILSMSLEM